MTEILTPGQTTLAQLERLLLQAFGGGLFDQGGVERQNIGLECNAIDDTDDVGDLAG